VGKIEEQNRACFLDRDGVLIEEVHYLKSPDQIRLARGIAEALVRLQNEGYLRIVVTNQSGVARGYFSEDAVAEVHRRIDELLAEEGAAVDAYYYCPHHVDGIVKPYDRSCDCRKPEPGMILNAAADHGIDLAASFLIGDKLSDVQAALRAGCAAFLVETGHGQKHAHVCRELGVPVAADIGSAVDAFLNGSSRSPLSTTL